MSIELTRWGKDHWCTFAYVETCCVDSHGRPNAHRVQTNHARHPFMGNPFDGEKYSIRLANGEELPGEDYDEWDCLDDMEAYGLLENLGTEINRQYRLTHVGKLIAGQLRGHKADGKNYATFQPQWADVPERREKIYEKLRN